MTTNVIVNGALGKMGREVVACALSDDAVRLCGCVEYPRHPFLGKDIGACLGREEAGVSLQAGWSGLPVESSVIIDFSAPEATSSLLEKMMQCRTRLVIGTTGMDEAGKESIQFFARTHPVVFSPNMSFGVNILFYLTELLSSKLGNDFDIEIIEAHHRLKKDSPSGTAKKLGEIAASSYGLSYDKAIKNGRSGITQERPKKEIGMHAIRGGDIVGDHTVLFAGPGERIELSHRAHSRAPLARGAIVAAKWLSSKEPGLYTMLEVLGLTGLK
jgi:4-hydroxy-tetrahydrodipicolinate reductase